MMKKIPNTNIQYEITEQFDSAQLGASITKLLNDDNEMARFKENPVSALGDMGIQISEDDFDNLSPDDFADIIRNNADGPPMDNASVAMVVATVVTITH